MQEKAIYPIPKKQVLNDTEKLFVVSAPQVAREATPGMFVIVRTDETGEHIPLTIADFNREAGNDHAYFPGGRQIHPPDGHARSGAGL